MTDVLLLCRWLRMMQGKTIKPDPFKRMAGSEVIVEWLESDPNAMTEPIVIESPDGLGMKMPEGLTVSGVAEILGENTPVEVIGEVSYHAISKRKYSFTMLPCKYRCCHAVEYSRLDAWQVGRILRH